jgi:hypothetical protein
MSFWHDLWRKTVIYSGIQSFLLYVRPESSLTLNIWQKQKCLKRHALPKENLDSLTWKEPISRWKAKSPGNTWNRVSDWLTKREASPSNRQEIKRCSSISPTMKLRSLWKSVAQDEILVY